MAKNRLRERSLQERSPQEISRPQKNWPGEKLVSRQNQARVKKFTLSQKENG
jgi:hypothetical protein